MVILLTEDKKSSERGEKYRVDLDKIMAKGEVNEELWKEIQKKLQGSSQEVKQAIELFFKNYKNLPQEADDLVCEYASKDQPYEYRLLIASYFSKKDLSFTYRFHEKVLGILEEDDDKRIQELIVDRLEERRKLIENMQQFYKNLSSIFSYASQSWLRNYQTFQAIQKSTLTTWLKSVESPFLSYYSAGTLSGIVVPERPKEEHSAQLIGQLLNCPKGKSGWSQYQEICGGILEYLFVPPLRKPISQSRSESGVHIRDFILQIPVDLEGFWGYCQMKHDSVGLVAECKDYTDQIDGNDVVITAKYLHERRSGNFGILLCRENPSAGAIKETGRIWRESGKLIVTLTDEDLIDMIKLKENEDEPEKIIERKIFDFRTSLD